MKYVIIIILLVLAGIGGWMYYGQFDSKFTGKLEVVNTGCFADGECFVVVDSKHVTVIRGWSQDVVGSVQGLKEGEGYGDLEKYLGQEIEVYAKELEYGNYTLYGNADYYIEVK